MGSEMKEEEAALVLLLHLHPTHRKEKRVSGEEMNKCVSEMIVTSITTLTNSSSLSLYNAYSIKKLTLIKVRLVSVSFSTRLAGTHSSHFLFQPR